LHDERTFFNTKLMPVLRSKLSRLVLVWYFQLFSLCCTGELEITSGPAPSRDPRN
jgi:hypothetical protein